MTRITLRSFPGIFLAAISGMPEDQAMPLPIGEREIAQEIEAALDYSSRTLPVHRADMFAFDATPSRANSSVTNHDELSSDPMVRLEQKLDLAIHLLATLKVKVDSIDAVLARIIHRLA
jgi:hypothetical protein